MRESPLRELHGAATTYEDLGDCRVAWSHADLDDEYGALRSRAALFDHSSVGLVAITGEEEDVHALLDDVVARDISYLAPERSMTTLVLADDGQPVDIVTVYRLEDGVLIESSFGNGTCLLDHLRARQESTGTTVDIIDLSAERTVIGIEGPYAWAEVGRILDQELTALPFESVVGSEWSSDPILFARSGFTAEYGYKVIADHEVAADIYRELAKEVQPVGQRTLEVAMVEVRQPIFHREFQPERGELEDVVACGWNWLVDLNKDGYCGRDALVARRARPASARTVGCRLAMACAEDTPVVVDDTVVGTVLFGVPSPALRTDVGLVRLSPDLAAAGLDIGGETPQGASLGLTTLSAPFIIPTSWRVPLF